MQVQGGSLTTPSACAKIRLWDGWDEEHPNLSPNLSLNLPGTGTKAGGRD
jgi:hypothetical protein